MQATSRVLAAVLVVAAASPASAALTGVGSFGANPGALTMYEYVPSGLAQNRPLVVVLHGCTQTAAAMESAGWNELADAQQFAVIYPEQATANNPVRCFNWAGEYGDTANLVRGQGENASIISMIDKAIATHGSDPDRVYIVGFSAGAAFTSVMLATYPERFAAGAIMSGLPYRCATSVNGAFSCQSPGVTKPASQWGDLVRAAAPTFAGTRPRVQIWHGSTDATVVPANATQLVAQWTDVAGTDATADETETIGAATRSAYKLGGQIVVEEYRITGMGHATAVGAADGECPARTGAYFEERGLCSTLRAAKFFGLGNSIGPGGDGGGDDGAGDDGSPDDGGGDDSTDDGGDGDDGAGDDGDNGNGATDDGAPNTDLPGCSLNAAGTPTGLAFIGIVLAAVLRRRRR